MTYLHIRVSYCNQHLYVLISCPDCETLLICMNSNFVGTALLDSLVFRSNLKNTPFQTRAHGDIDSCGRLYPTSPPHFGPLSEICLIFHYCIASVHSMDNKHISESPNRHARPPNPILESQNRNGPESQKQERSLLFWKRLTIRQTTTSFFVWFTME